MDASIGEYASRDPRRRPPDIQIEKHYVFSTSLQNLQLEGPLIPGSDPPCSHCRSKRLKCICDAVQLVGKYVFSSSSLAAGTPDEHPPSSEPSSMARLQVTATASGCASMFVVSTCRASPVCALSSTPAYETPELGEVSRRLERSREALSDIPIDEWKRHTAKTDVFKKVIPTIKQKVLDKDGHCPELLINSWTKLYEVLTKTPILKRRLKHLQQLEPKQPRVLKSIHLCECPGGFVAATNHFIKTEAKGVLFSWRAASLNPYFEGCNPLEALDDDGLYRHTERRWITSPDGSGDLRSKESIEFLWKQLTRQTQNGVPPFGLADLVTADGSFDVQHDPARQEELVAPLIYAELVAILGLLQIQGSAVLKAYALHSHHSVSLLAILSMCFTQVAVVKPQMSRSGNSEVYLLGLGFRGIRSPLLRALSSAVDGFTQDMATIPREWLPDEFVAECRKCAEFFTQLQAEHLEVSLQKFKALSSHELWQLSLEKEQLADEFISSNNLLERVQGVLADRIRFREVYTRLQSHREEKWLHHGGCSRALCLLTSQAGIDALLQRAQASLEDADDTGPSANDEQLPTKVSIRDFFSVDVAWREEMLQGLRKAEYNARPSCWLTLLRPLAPYRVQMSRFADDRLLAIVGELRHQLPFLFPHSTPDFLLLEGRPSAVGERLGEEELPPPSSIDLLLALKQLEMPAGAPGPVASSSGASHIEGPLGETSEKELAGIWRKQYPVCVEISSWSAPLALPVQLMLRRYGCSCFVVITPSKQLQHQEQQLTREVLEGATPRSAPVLGVQEVDILAAFAEAETSDYFKRQMQQVVLPSLPARGAPLVSLDITGVQHWRREEISEGGTERGESVGAKGSEGERSRHRGVVAAVHEEMAQAEMEASLILLGQIIQGLLVLSPEGNIVLRLHSCYTRYTASLLMLLAICFTSSCLYKPPSVPSWSSDAFFLGKGKRQEESTQVLQLLFTAWGILVAKHKSESVSLLSAETARLGGFKRGISTTTAAATINCGGLSAHWVLQQCIKAKLFTNLVSNKWILLFNNRLLRQQLKDLSERTELVSLACRAAGVALAAAKTAPGSNPPVKARVAAGATLKCLNQQERRKKVALFLRAQGILDLVLRKDSPYHQSLSASEAREDTAKDDEWGGQLFDSVEVLALLAGAQPTLSAQATEEIWREA
ncbi:ftsj-like methyltransferase domain-containing protein [Cyclospora cayetanensis]|uniref:Cap-specific mRNA (nucleoside-2'-O-)-methyltransferase 2 n=1 Tax=Cyclospora cayetanensis TaxID=88456 RepID=A0A1D3CXU5_9EIME|nr:ftsj-like methyltransferase domain-containing protein [Cyclospora cayetanensis]